MLVGLSGIKGTPRNTSELRKQGHSVKYGNKKMSLVSQAGPIPEQGSSQVYMFPSDVEYTRFLCPP